MTSRRDFLRRCALLAAGTIAADQLEILDRLSHARVFTTGGFASKKIDDDYIYLASSFGEFEPGTHIAIIRSGQLVSNAIVTAYDPRRARLTLSRHVA